MLGISYFSIISAIIVFNLGLLFLFILKHYFKDCLYNNVNYLFIVIFLLTLRLLLPLDLSKGYVISSTKIYPWLINILQTRFGSENITVEILIISLWFIISIILLIKDGLLYLSELREIKEFLFIENMQVSKISLKLPKVKIYVTPNISAPKVTGFIRPHVYLPPMSLSDDELELIIKHEVCHIQGGDIIIKVVYNILKNIFWWNPLIRHFESEVNDILELRCDKAVVKNMDTEYKEKYLNTILSAIKQIRFQSDMNYSTKGTLNFASAKSDKFIKQRFRIILQEKNNTKKHKFTISIIFALFFLSFFIIIQPAFYPNISDLTEEINVSSEGSYVVISEDNLKMLYIDGVFQWYLSEEEFNTYPYLEMKKIKETK